MGMISITTIIFVVLILVGIGIAAFGKYRMNTTLMVVGGIMILAGLYCIVSAAMAPQV